jgi:hypothetical protein
MEIQFFCPRWGNEHLSMYQLFSEINIAGFHGIEMTIPTGNDEKKELLSLQQQFNLQLIAQQGEAGTAKHFDEYLQLFEYYIRNAASVNPLFINSQSGKDFYSFEQNCKVIEKAFALEKELNVCIIHELHRGKFTYSPTITEPYMQQYPTLKFGADFSHWVNVSESMLTDPIQQSIVEKTIARACHIHARVGYEEGPQISDPRAPEWQYALNAHLAWWDAVVQNAKNMNRDVLTITPEFGPAPYMPLLPYTLTPVSSQWDNNVYIKEMLNQRYSKR